MSIERLFARVMTILSCIFLVLVLMMYPRKYAFIPMIFIAGFFISDYVLLKENRSGAGKLKISKKIIILLSTLICLCLLGLALLYRFGPYQLL